jgi:methyl-accepting chemotaxis protein
MRIRAMRWTISRKLFLGFVVAAITTLSLSAITLYSIKAMEQSQGVTAAAARETLLIGDAAAAAAKAYQIIGAAMINPNLVEAEAAWKTQAAATSKLFAQVKEVLLANQDKRLLALADLSYGDIVDGFETKLLPALKRGEGITSNTRFMHAEIADAAVTVADAFLKLRNAQTARAAAANAQASVLTEWLAYVAAGLAAATIVAMILICIALTRSVGAPVRAMAGQIARLAKGETAMEIVGTKRQDEIGIMAGALEVFRASMIDAERLRAEQEEMKERAEVERQTAMARLVDEFQASVQRIVAAVSSAARELQATSRSMSQSAEQTGVRSMSVATRSQQASGNVRTVAAATEQLTQSVAEIGGRVTESSRMAADAVDQAERSKRQMRQLSAAAQQIGDVVTLIDGIADQTNLLALNATIEAARAGDAGKGFAVVASEVKTLATQTGQAIQEIAAKIAEMQEAAGQSVTATEAIGETIVRLNGIAQDIARAVQEQLSATDEILRNVKQLSAGAENVTETIGEVAQAVGETGAAAHQVLHSANHLAEQGRLLEEKMGAFLARARAA